MVRIVDEPAVVVQWKVLQTWMENTPAVADDESLVWRRGAIRVDPLIPEIGVSAYGRCYGGHDGVGGGWAYNQHWKIQQRSVGRRNQRVIGAHRAVTEPVHSWFGRNAVGLPRIGCVQVYAAPWASFSEKLFDTW